MRTALVAIALPALCSEPVQDRGWVLQVDHSRAVLRSPDGATVADLPTSTLRTERSSRWGLLWRDGYDILLDLRYAGEEAEARPTLRLELSADLSMDVLHSLLYTAAQAQWEGAVVSIAGGAPVTLTIPIMGSDRVGFRLQVEGEQVHLRGAQWAVTPRQWALSDLSGLEPILRADADQTHRVVTYSNPPGPHAIIYDVHPAVFLEADPDIPLGRIAPLLEVAARSARSGEIVLWAAPSTVFGEDNTPRWPGALSTACDEATFRRPASAPEHLSDRRTLASGHEVAVQRCDPSDPWFMLWEPEGEILLAYDLPGWPEPSTYLSPDRTMFVHTGVRTIDGVRTPQSVAIHLPEEVTAALLKADPPPPPPR